MRLVKKSTRANVIVSSNHLQGSLSRKPKIACLNQQAISETKFFEEFKVISTIVYIRGHAKPRSERKDYKCMNPFVWFTTYKLTVFHQLKWYDANSNLRVNRTCYLNVISPVSMFIFLKKFWYINPQIPRWRVDRNSTFHGCLSLPVVQVCLFHEYDPFYKNHWCGLKTLRHPNTSHRAKMLLWTIIMNGCQLGHWIWF